MSVCKLHCFISRNINIMRDKNIMFFFVTHGCNYNIVFIFKIYFSLFFTIIQRKINICSIFIYYFIGKTMKVCFCN